VLVVLSGLGRKVVSHKSVYGLVRKLGFRWKRGVKRLSKGNPVARAAFAPKIQRLADEASQGLRTLVYIDEAHIHCDLDEGYGWAPGGQPYEVASSSPGLSKKVSLYGAFVFNDPQVVLWKATRCNTVFTLAFLVHLANILGDAPKPTIVWDGAPWHKPAYLMDIARNKLGFEIVFLPPYSPDFMPVEALWRWLREEVTRNNCHETVDELVADVIEFGRNVNSDQLALITRLWPKLELREEEVAAAELLSSTPPTAPTPAAADAHGKPARPDPKTVAEVFRLTEGQWCAIQQLLPAQEDRRGDPRGRRGLVEAAVWKERSQVAWRHLPDNYPPFQTVHHNYLQWRENGVWAAILETLDALPYSPPPLLAFAG
tara:strand:- start:18 stop:1133 length:1116 start_codon:yes stop_codon:yes gene_type:complete